MAPIVSSLSPRFTALKTASSKMSASWNAHSEASRLLTSQFRNHGASRTRHNCFGKNMEGK